MISEIDVNTGEYGFEFPKAGFGFTGQILRARASHVIVLLMFLCFLIRYSNGIFCTWRHNK